MKRDSLKVGDRVGYVRFEGATPRLVTITSLTKQVWQGSAWRDTGIEAVQENERVLLLKTAAKLIPLAEAEARIEESKQRAEAAKRHEEREAVMAQAIAKATLARPDEPVHVELRRFTGQVTLTVPVALWNMLVEQLNVPEGAVPVGEAGEVIPC